MLKKHEACVEDMLMCAKSRREKFEYESAQTALTPKGNEQYEQAIKDCETLQLCLDAIRAVGELPEKVKIEHLEKELESDDLTETEKQNVAREILIRRERNNVIDEVTPILLNRELRIKALEEELKKQSKAPEVLHILNEVGEKIKKILEA